MQVMLTPTHLAIVMEYAAGGELFERICNAGRFSEDEVKVLALYFLKSFRCGGTCNWVCTQLCWADLNVFIFCRLGFSSSNSFLESAIVMLWYVRCEHFIHQFILQEPFSSSFDQALDLKIDLGSLQQICHRDLKLENTLLDGSPAPRLKICDFGYSKVCKFWNTHL